MFRNEYLILVLIFVILSFLFLGCTETVSPTTKGAGVGAAVGATAGALIDQKNPWRGAVIGGVLGGVAGGAIVELSNRASREAAYSGKPVAYRRGDTTVEAIPIASNERTHCRKIRKRIWKKGRLIKDTVEEVCESEKTTNRY